MMSDMHKHFVVPAHYYVKTFVALLVLTVVTVLVAQFNFGKWNIVIAMAVALIKACLVGAIFMGLKWDKKINVAFFVMSFAFLAIFLTFSLLDVSSRAQADPLESGTFNLKSPVRHPQNK